MFDYPPEDYNYVDFILRREIPLFEAFRHRMHVGESASGDFQLHRLDDDAPVNLSDYWADGPCVVEFGSFT